MKKTSIFLAAFVAALCCRFGDAQILRLDLPGMATRVDNAVFAEIVDRKIFRVDHPIDGELWFTTLTLKGESLLDDTQMTTKVTFMGGWDPDSGTGVYNSEAPEPDDIRIGNRVVAFYKWCDNLGADVAANSLYTAHGGIYRTARNGDATIVLGRGEGYAVSSNMTVSQLRAGIAEARQSKQHGQD